MTIPRTVAASAAALALSLTACSSGGGAQTDPTVNGAANADGCSQEQQIAEWPMDRRLAQLLMGGVNTDGGESAVESAITAIAKGQVGGVNFLGSGSYAYSDNQLARAIDAGGGVPPFLAVDEEGGRVQRLQDQTGYIPSAREMGETMTTQQVQNQAKEIGRTMRKLSLNMDLAPVVDVSDQESYEVIGDRSFSSDPDKVTEYAGAFAEGLRQSGIVPVLKHFPGLGSGTGNTDFERAETPPLSELRKKDLVPYESLLLNDPVAVMTTNAAVPGLSAGKAASLSPQTYELLREDYGFTGVAMTDSLSAAAILSDMELEKAVAKALAAGADIALWDGVSEAPQIRRFLQKAVKKGRLSEEQVNTSVRRVLQLKGIDLCAGR